MSHVETKEAVSRRRAGWSFVPPCGAAMETDPTKLGTMKLMGTFGVPSYTSFGDEYMKKIGAAHRFRPSCSAPGGLSETLAAAARARARAPRRSASSWQMAAGQ